MKRLGFSLTRLLAAVILGIATTFSVAWGLALWAPIADGRGIVSLDGDHLQPWVIHMVRPGAERFVYFEKGRVYSKRNVGPPAASSSAVACWSFATSTRSNARFARGSITLPPELEEEMAKQPRTAWGIAEDRRGWPLHALACTFIGTTATDALHVYTIHHGVRVEADTSNIAFASGVESLDEIRALPVRPLWQGLVLNTAIGAVVWYLAMTGASHLIVGLKARLRTPAGHCPACNYDLKGDFDSGCPECGWNKPPSGADPGAPDTA